VTLARKALARSRAMRERGGGGGEREIHKKKERERERWRGSIRFCRSLASKKELLNHYNRDSPVWLDGAIPPTPVPRPPSQGL
jgi:hypothetical protein